MPRAREFVQELIQSVSGRIKGQDSFVQEQFQCLLSLFTRDITCLLSDLGLDFLATFGASRDQNVVKEMRKLYVSYKLRDSMLLESKKSILYSLIMKVVVQMYSQMSDQQVMKVADASSAEMIKELQQ